MKGLNIATGVFAIIGLAPWAIFLGGLCKYTEVILDWSWSTAAKQQEYMLEWYLVSANFLYFLLIAIMGFASWLHRTHSLLIMFLAVNTALLIYMATNRIQLINAINGSSAESAIDDITNFFNANPDKDPLPYLRAIAAGEVSTAAWNFFMAILISIAGTAKQIMNTDGEPRQAAVA